MFPSPSGKPFFHTVPLFIQQNYHKVYVRPSVRLSIHPSAVTLCQKSGLLLELWLLQQPGGDDTWAMSWCSKSSLLHSWDACVRTRHPPAPKPTRYWDAATSGGLSNKVRSPVLPPRVAWHHEERENGWRRWGQGCGCGWDDVDAASRATIVASCIVCY